MKLYKNLLWSLLILTPIFSYPEKEDYNQKNQSSQLYSNKWVFLREKFEIYPKDEFAKPENKFSKWLGFFLPYGMVYAWTKEKNTTLIAEFKAGNYDPLFKTCAWLAGTSIVSTFAYKTISSTILRRIEKANFMNFIENWERNKKYTPEEMHKFFEDISLDYHKNRNSIAFEIDMLLKKIKSRIKTHFNNKLL